MRPRRTLLSALSLLALSLAACGSSDGSSGGSSGTTAPPSASTVVSFAPATETTVLSASAEMSSTPAATGPVRDQALIDWLNTTPNRLDLEAMRSNSAVIQSGDASACQDMMDASFAVDDDLANAPQGEFRELMADASSKYNLATGTCGVIGRADHSTNRALRAADRIFARAEAVARKSGVRV